MTLRQLALPFPEVVRPRIVAGPSVRRLPAYRVAECEHEGPASSCRRSWCRYSLIPDGVDPEEAVPCALAHCDYPRGWGEIGALLGVSDTRAQQIAAGALSRPQLARWLAQLGRSLDMSEREIQRAIARTARAGQRRKRGAE